MISVVNSFFDKPVLPATLRVTVGPDHIDSKNMELGFVDSGHPEFSGRELQKQSTEKNKETTDDYGRKPTGYNNANTLVLTIKPE